MTPSPKVSLIMPVYNSAAYLERAVASALEQTEPALELIAIDDGSTDGSLAILERIAASDRRLVVLQQANDGPYSARIKGIGRARAPWIGFIDADDCILPGALETWSAAAERDSADLVVGNGFTFADDSGFDPSARHILKNHTAGTVGAGADWITRCVDLSEWPHYLWLQLVRRDIIKNLDLICHGRLPHLDIIWSARIAMAAKRVVYVGEPLYAWRNNPKSISRNTDEGPSLRAARSYLIVIAELEKLAREAEKPRLRKALLRQANREGGHLMGLIRKRIVDPESRREIAKKFREEKTYRAMLAGAVTASEYLRAIKCLWIMRKIG